jgi:hypothetical protein
MRPLRLFSGGMALRIGRSSVAAIVVVILSLAASGCGGAASPAAFSPPSAPLPAQKPPSPKTWPAYPRFSPQSCWTRPSGSTRPVENRVVRSAPSFAPSKQGQPTPPKEIVRRALARFGDRRFVRRIELGAPPRFAGFGKFRPPANALWAYVYAPAAARPDPHPTPERIGEWMLAKWEANTLPGGLRDDFCAAGGRPLVGASIVPRASGYSGAFQAIFALMPRFPNLKPSVFRRRVDLISRRYGFRVRSLRLLRPREIAPLLVVETTPDRKAFVRDIPVIMALLNPTSSYGKETALTFEAFFLEVRDEKGPFVRVENIRRAWIEGGQWSWNPCAYPYRHSWPGKRCP